LSREATKITADFRGSPDRDLILAVGMTRSLSLALVFLLLVLATGCGGSYASVSGSVTIDGKPLKHGAVTFDPEDGKAQTAGSLIENGSYSAKVRPGRYRVTVVGAGEGVAGKSQADVMKMSEQELKALTLNPVPADAAGNKEVVEIKSGSQTHDIKLTSKGK
jgi:hypothetical protein